MPGPSIAPFPLKDAHKLMLKARQASVKGEVSATFSLRKLLLWAEMDGLLQQAKLSRVDALIMAFHLAVEAKTYGEDRVFLRGLFQSIFGAECILPAFDTTAEHLHPLATVVEVIVRAGVPLWLYGPTGSSKSHSVEAVAALLKRPYIRIQGTGELTVDDLLGSRTAQSGSVFFEHGPLPLAMKSGAVLNVDEVAMIPPQVLAEFQAVLEGKPLVIKANAGEVVHPAPGFALVMNDNTMGLGEGTSYIGTHTQNEAFRDRFVFLEMDYMDAKVEAKILAKALDDLTQRRGWTIEASIPAAPATVVKPSAATTRTVDTDTLNALRAALT